MDLAINHAQDKRKDGVPLNKGNVSEREDYVAGRSVVGCSRGSGERWRWRAQQRKGILVS